MKYFCCDPHRREELRGHPELNGIDFLEVDDDPSQPDEQRQRQLFVHFFQTSQLDSLTTVNFRLEGGDRIPGSALVLESVHLDPPASGRLVLRLTAPGDFAAYVLRVVASPDTTEPPDGFDPLYAAVEFSFKVGCPSDFDCQPACDCPPAFAASPVIDYLAKDYASFRRLMLDRLSSLVPSWQARSPADLGVTLVEVLAYVADRLSYQQDAVATEAYLGTARRRVSIRRHARLVDYHLHDGCNARAWLHLTVREPLRLVPVNPVNGFRVRFLTRCLDVPQIPATDLPRTLAERRPEVFELIHPIDLLPAHNELRFYTWAHRDCCLPKGATRATLLDDEIPEKRLRLRSGDVLILEERLGPHTGDPADADRTRRHAVRLTRVSPEAVPSPDDNLLREPGPLRRDPLTQQPVVDIEWAPEDALPFPFCLSVTLQRAGRTIRIPDVTLAVGNVALVDHGRTLDSEENLRDGPHAAVPEPSFLAPDQADCHCAFPPPASAPVPPRFRPRLQERPLTIAVPYDHQTAPSARFAFQAEPRSALPAIQVLGEIDGRITPWQPHHDLLGSHPDDPDFVVEIESDQSASLRFGDGRHGLRPTPGTRFSAKYRVGLGVSGNVGREAIHHFVAEIAAITAVRNPLSSWGGTEPESAEEARQAAPWAFRRQERAVTAADYAVAAERMPGIQRAAATFRWTGSWRTAFVAADRLGGGPVSIDFEDDLRRHLEPFRMAGQDLEVEAPRYVPLVITLHVCVLPNHFRSDVHAALLRIFTSRVLPDGRPGLFHPDRFTFGQTFYLSPLYAAARSVEGVGMVRITQFECQGCPDPEPLQTGKLVLRRLEIARLDNNPNHAERGVFNLVMDGGK